MSNKCVPGDPIVPLRLRFARPSPMHPVNYVYNEDLCLNVLIGPGLPRPVVSMPGSLAHLKSQQVQQGED